MRALHVEFASGRDVLGHYWGLLSGGGLAIDLLGLRFSDEGRLDGVRPPELLDPPGLDEAAGLDESPVAVAVSAALAPALPHGTPPGGALLEVAPHLQVGAVPRLQVHVKSIRKTYPLDVRVAELRPRAEGVELVVAFLHSLPPDELLDAAWADGCDAPQRRSRRLVLRTPVRFERLDGAVETRDGHLLNLSMGGCCVEGTSLPPPGTQVLLTTEPGEVAADAPALKLVGRVRWTERPSAGLMGIEFLKPAPEVQALLQAQGLYAGPELEKADKEG